MHKGKINFFYVQNECIILWGRQYCAKVFSGTVFLQKMFILFLSLRW